MGRHWSLMATATTADVGHDTDRSAAPHRRGDPTWLRSSFLDWAADSDKYPADVAETALAHIIGDKTRAAYERTDLFNSRRKLMADWVAACPQSWQDRSLTSGIRRVVHSKKP